MNRSEIPVLRGPRVTLRRPQPDDAETRRRLGNDPDIVRMYGGSRAVSPAMSEAEALRWVQRVQDPDHAWVIEAGSLIGSIRLDRVDRCAPIRNAGSSSKAANAKPHSSTGLGTTTS